MTESLSSSELPSCVDSTRITSEELWTVVEQLIWPPRKKATLPVWSRRGAGVLS